MDSGEGPVPLREFVQISGRDAEHPELHHHGKKEREQVDRPLPGGTEGPCDHHRTCEGEADGSAAKRKSRRPAWRSARAGEGLSRMRYNIDDGPEVRHRQRLEVLTGKREVRLRLVQSSHDGGEQRLYIADGYVVTNACSPTMVATTGTPAIRASTRLRPYDSAQYPRTIRSDHDITSRSC